MKTKAMKNAENGLFDAKVLENWERHYDNLAAYQALQDIPHMPFPAALKKDLKQWTGIQRRMQHLLPVPLKNKLAAIDFDFTEQQPDWDHYLEQLTAFFQIHGHTFLPAQDPAYEGLRDWLLRQIQGQQYLPKERYAQLDALGVDWSMGSTKDLRWQQMYLKLKAFYQQHGHSRVPQKWAQDRQLANWVSVQRRVYGQHKIPAGRVRLLEELDFVWHIQSQFDAQWDSFYRQLAAFRQQHGHCRVPNPKTNNRLAVWACQQKKNKAQLTARQVELLDALGFDWPVPVGVVVPWDQMYDRLAAFQQAFGHTRVPVSWRQDPKLGKWVSRMRQQKDRLFPAQVELLDAIGFDWSKRWVRERACQPI